MAAHLKRRFGDVDIEQLRRDANNGVVPSVRIGRALAFDPAAVEAALLERARKPVTFMDAAREVAAEQRTKNGGDQ